MGNPETHTCGECGYTWKHGRHGGHSCSSHLRARLTNISHIVSEMEEDSRFSHEVDYFSRINEELEVVHE